MPYLLIISAATDAWTTRISVQADAVRENPAVIKQKVHFHFLLLLQSVSGNHLECLFYVCCFLCTCFKVGNSSFCLAPRNGSFLRDLKHKYRRSGTTRLDSSMSILLPSTTNGKLSGSLGLDCTRNSSRQLSSASKDLALLTSKTKTQQSAPR